MDKAQSVIAAFDAAAARYDGAAAAQRRVAARLIDLCDMARPRSILDLGCGTGAVLALAGERFAGARLTGVDAAPAMLDVARARLPGAQFLCQDVTAPVVADGYDLILSSMVLHWLDDPVAVLGRWKGLLNPGGMLAVALPVAGSFAEWRDLCAAAGLTDRLWPFPAADAFTGLGNVDVQACPLSFATVRDFLAHIKQTGAHSARTGTHALKPGQMKALLHAAPAPFKTSYQVLYLRIGA